MAIKDCCLGNELVHVNTNQMLQGIPQEQHGGLEPKNILDCRERDPLVLTASVKRNKFSFYLTFACLVLCLLLLLFSSVWMVVVTLNTDLSKDDIMIKFVNNVMVVFVFVMMSQMILNRAGWMVDTG